METIFSGEQTFFATMNRPGPGTSPMTPALLERFDISGRTLVPLSIEHRRKLREEVSDLEEILKDEEKTGEILDFMSQNQSSSEVKSYLKKEGDEFKKRLEKEFEEMGYEIRLPDSRELKEVKEKIKGVDLNVESNLFLDYFKANVNMCVKGRKEDFSLCPKCDKENYPCSKLKYFSNRAEESLTKYSKSLAWLVGKDKADLETLKTLLPYVLQHRVEVNEAKLEERQFKPKGYWRSKKFRLIKQVVEEDLLRFSDSLEDIKEITKAYLKGERIPKKHPSPWYELIKRSR